MAKLTAILMTLAGLVLSLEALNVYDVPYGSSIVGLSFLIAGIGKLVRNFKK
jgi:hypothetical protein